MHPTPYDPDRDPAPSCLWPDAGRLPVLDWLAEARVRVRRIRAVHTGSTLAVTLLRELLADLADEMARERDDEPCPRRAPLSWAEWRDTRQDLHRALRLVRRALPLAMQAAADAAAADRDERAAA